MDKPHAATRRSGTVHPSPEAVAFVRRGIERDGVVATAKAIGVDREPLLRVVAGTGVRRGTAALIEAAAKEPTP